MYILKPENFRRADDRRNVVRVKQVFKHHAKMTRAAVNYRSKQLAASFRNARKQ
jgi:hypothetical protein